jgi:hypothetical protein
MQYLHLIVWKYQHTKEKSTKYLTSTLQKYESQDKKLEKTWQLNAM